MSYVLYYTFVQSFRRTLWFNSRMLTSKVVTHQSYFVIEADTGQPVTCINESYAWISVKLTCANASSFHSKNIIEKKWWACNDNGYRGDLATVPKFYILQTNLLLRRFDVSKYLNEECNATCNGHMFTTNAKCVYMRQK